MKTTLDLPDDLVRAVKIRAVEENRKLKDTIADLLRSGLAQKRGVPATVGKRVKLPLVECTHEAQPASALFCCATQRCRPAAFLQDPATLAIRGAAAQNLGR